MLEQIVNGGLRNCEDLNNIEPFRSVHVKRLYMLLMTYGISKNPAIYRRHELEKCFF